MNRRDFSKALAALSSVAVLPLPCVAAQRVSRFTFTIAENGPFERDIIRYYVQNDGEEKELIAVETVETAVMRRDAGMRNLEFVGIDYNDWKTKRMAELGPDRWPF
jgi:hypothetical protein